MRLLLAYTSLLFFIQLNGQVDHSATILANSEWKFVNSWLGDDTVVLKPVVVSDTSVVDAKTKFKNYWSVDRLLFDNNGLLERQYCYAECAIGENPREVKSFELIDGKIDVRVRNDFLSHTSLKYLYKIQLWTSDRIVLYLVPRE